MLGFSVDMGFSFMTTIDPTAGISGLPLTRETASVRSDDSGEWMHRFIAELYPICRSITGDGFRATLHRIRAHIPLEIHEVPTGTQVYDWTVPKEWNIRDAWVKNSRGEKVIDYQKSNLHVVNYSVPIRRKMW